MPVKRFAFRPLLFQIGVREGFDLFRFERTVQVDDGLERGRGGAEIAFEGVIVRQGFAGPVKDVGMRILF
jgi:hypothetical protein